MNANTLQAALALLFLFTGYPAALCFQSGQFVPAICLAATSLTAAIVCLIVAVRTSPRMSAFEWRAVTYVTIAATIGNAGIWFAHKAAWLSDPIQTLIAFAVYIVIASPVVYYFAKQSKAN